MGHVQNCAPSGSMDLTGQARPPLLRGASDSAVIEGSASLSLRRGKREAHDTYAKCADLVRQVQSGDHQAMAELYALFSRIARVTVYRQLGAQDLEDILHDAFLIVVQAIRRGDIREPERLMGFVRTVVQRQVLARIEIAVQQRCQRSLLVDGEAPAAAGVNPEQAVLRRQKAEIVKTALYMVTERDRQILVRFYLREESQEEICRAMNLTPTQFRLLKSRAKARFGEAGRRHLSRFQAA